MQTLLKVYCHARRWAGCIVSLGWEWASPAARWSARSGNDAAERGAASGAQTLTTCFAKARFCQIPVTVNAGVSVHPAGHESSKMTCSHVDWKIVQPEFVQCCRQPQSSWACERRRQFAEATRGAREAARDTQNAADLADPDAPGLFAFINASLGDGSAAAAVHRRVHADERRSDGLGLGVGAGRGEAGGGYFGNGPAAKAKAALALPDRQALAAQQVPLHGAFAAPCKPIDNTLACGLPVSWATSSTVCTSERLSCWWVQDALQNLRQKVGRLKGMAVRNAKDRVMASQVRSSLLCTSVAH